MQIEGLGSISYVLDNQGHGFFNSEVQKGLKKWKDVWIYKMALNSQGNFVTYYFKEIKESDTARARFLRRYVLNLKKGGERSIANTL
ncbi:hypothetical protein LCGC14_2882450 [marine sediment metagenome]|uniref:Uncharacterized protein n=1 Tax=marine sediment metagenome TaxID=412755 RepID=A0A0F8XZP5_9ZZZZ